MSNESGQAIIQSQCNTGWVNGSMGTWSHPEPGLWRVENLYSKAFGSFGGVSDDQWNWWPCKIQVQNIAIYDICSKTSRQWQWHQLGFVSFGDSGLGTWKLCLRGEGFIKPIEPSGCYNLSMACSCSEKTHVTLVVNVTSLLKPVACCIVQSTLVEKWFQNTFGCGHFVGSIIFSDSIIFSPYFPTQIQYWKAMWIYCMYNTILYIYTIWSAYIYIYTIWSAYIIYTSKCH